ncbi:MAG: hypothetical protein IH610_03320 [Deltaproteobacteria bacterium]|nr:hypothetical protein [Deltaproteobacteria bacterium]
MHRVGVALAAFALCGLTASIAAATPSTQVWIPSTDIQAYKTVHLNFDTYLRAKTNDDGSRTAPVVVIGPTVGILPFEKIQAELGFDVISGGGDADKYPLYFHGKLATPENSLFKFSPAIAVGGYNFGTKSGDARNGELATNQDLVYGLVARTFPVIGRLSAGYFTGNKKVLLDENGNSDEKGVLLSWDRTMTEISDKLWVAVDYQGSNSALGALSFGASWAFAKNVSLLVGYDIYNKKATGGQDTFTMQLDINIP